MYRVVPILQFNEIIKKSRNIYLYGAGKLLIKHQDSMMKMGIDKKNVYIIDSDDTKKGQIVDLFGESFPIKTVNEMLSQIDENSIIIITCLAFREIADKLVNLPETKYVDIFSWKLEYLYLEEYDLLNKNVPENLKLLQSETIPRKIHYCWFGRNEIPERYKLWMDSWKKYCPDYEIVQWNEDNYDITKNKYVHQAYQSKKWGFVSDYARLDIIYNYGGIYLDTDVELLKPLDELLFQPAFMAFEGNEYVNTGLGFGASKKNRIIGEMLKLYDDRVFKKADGKFDLTTCLTIQTPVLRKYGLHNNGEYQIIDDISVLPEKVMNGKNYSTGRIVTKPYTFAIHHYDGSWLDEQQKNEYLKMQQEIRRGLKMPVLSVIMPSLNVVRYIDECITSVINQTLEDIEIICIDAGSTDGTYEKLEKYSQKDKRIILEKYEIKSYGAQVNHGIDIAKGKYVAIVETDDFVDARMFEELVEIADNNYLDFIKGDYEGFRGNQENNYNYVYAPMFGSALKGNYNTVINASDRPLLHVLGLNIWRGIYNRQFILNNNIKLNETAGAAFQDTGFYHQLICCAHRVMFVDIPYYKYRMDRDGSSFKNPDTLLYTYQEYHYILDETELEIDNKHLHYIYLKMINQFFMHLNRYAYINHKAVNSWNKIMHTVSWFVNKIRFAYNNEIISNQDFDEMQMNNIITCLVNPKIFYECCVYENKELYRFNKKLSEWLKQKKLVIFGTGSYGKSVFGLADKSNVKCFCDNNDTRESMFGIPVCRPDECVKRYGDAYYIIANKKSALEIKMQLENMGIRRDHILIYKRNEWNLNGKY